MIKYNVYIEDINAKTIKVYNIFEHIGFVKDLNQIIDIYNKTTQNIEHFKERLNNILRYYFWGKCEWEVIISDWPPSNEKYRFEEIKVDVYDQIYNNWGSFTEYILNHKDEILKMKSK